MPGISFLFKKRFHPSRIDQQKKLFIAEETVKNRQRSEEERSLEVKKELDIQSLESLGPSGFGNDARYGDLKFMYSQPTSGVDGRKIDLAGSNPYVGEEEDEAVQKFKMQMKRASGEISPADDIDEFDGDARADVTTTDSDKSKRKKNDEIKRNPNFSAANNQSALGKAVGKRRRDGQTLDEQQDRFAFLKGAPVEGMYAQNIQLRHKPFNEVVRNVQCFRCGEWGHQSGDRECSLRDNNPHDFARRKREDPLTYMNSSEFMHEKQRAILRTAAATSSSSSNNTTTSAATSSSSAFGTAVWNAPRGLVTDENEAESDPEADFIATLTRREKTLLLKKLRLLESGKSIYDPVDASEASSSNDDSSSGSDDDSDSSSGSSGISKHRKERHKSKKDKKRSHKKKSKKEKKSKTSKK
jgi:CBF1 interacting corepressor